MGGLEKVNSTDIVRAIHNSDLTDPFIEKIFLMHSTIAGTSHVVNIDEIEPNLEVGDRLDFYREAENPFDKKAILVKHISEKIGYVSMVDNEILANLMDAGKLIFGEIKYKKYYGTWLKIGFDIYLED
jgi:hypothetical protein